MPFSQFQFVTMNLLNLLKSLENSRTLKLIILSTALVHFGPTNRSIIGNLGSILSWKSTKRGLLLQFLSSSQCFAVTLHNFANMVEVWRVENDILQADCSCCYQSYVSYPHSLELVQVLFLGKEEKGKREKAGEIMGGGGEVRGVKSGQSCISDQIFVGLLTKIERVISPVSYRTISYVTRFMSSSINLIDISTCQLIWYGGFVAYAHSNFFSETCDVNW